MSCFGLFDMLATLPTCPRCPGTRLPNPALTSLWLDRAVAELWQDAGWAGAPAWEGARSCERVWGFTVPWRPIWAREKRWEPAPAEGRQRLGAGS